MTDLPTRLRDADTEARHAHREQFLIEKRGVYCRPEAKGYTGLKREAGRYSFEEAAERVGPNGPDGSQDGLSMWREDEAPEYSSACYSDTRAWEEGRKKGAADAAAEIERLKREAEISAQSLRNVQSVREHEHKRAEAALAEIERLTALLEETTRALDEISDESNEAEISWKAVKATIHKSRAYLARIKEPRNDQ